MRDAAAAQFDQALAQALFAAYVRDIRLRSGARLAAQIERARCPHALVRSASPDGAAMIPVTSIGSPATDVDR